MSDTQPTVLPWHKAAADEINKALLRQNPTVSAIIARHDLHAAQHATTLRLLEGIANMAEMLYDSPVSLHEWIHTNLPKIRAHLAAHSKPDEMQQSAKQEGSK